MSDMGCYAKMATPSGESEPDSQQPEIVNGEEPGASRSSILMSDDSFEDLSPYESEDMKINLPSGTIQEIRGDNDQAETESLSTTSSLSRPDTPADPVAAVADSVASLAVNDAKKENGASLTNHAEPGESDTDDVKSESRDAMTSSHHEEMDYVHTEQWRLHNKHFFILSESGKPIYSRHGKEDKLVTVMGVMQALVSFIQDKQDSINCMIAGDHKFVFLVQDHLIHVVVARTNESTHQLKMQLLYMHNQVLSVLTLSQLKRIFKQRRNYDLRRLLTGAEKFFDSLTYLLDSEPSFLLTAVRCLPMEAQTRDIIAQCIAQNAKVKDLVFAILITNDHQLITLVRMRKYFLHPTDLHLIFNLVSASESFKTAESWTPICLPNFDSGGYLHGHISYLDEQCHTCMLLLTVDREAFFQLSDCREKILQRLNKYNCLKSIHSAIQNSGYSISQVGLPDLRHFLYKSKSASQFTSPAIAAPYKTPEQQERLFGLYQYLHKMIHNGSRPLKILYHIGTHEALLGWVTSGFELFAVFGPLVTKPAAITSVNKLLKWIKKEEERLFIMNSPTF